MATKGENGERYGNVACYMLHATCQVAVCFRRYSQSPSLHLCFRLRVYFLFPSPVPSSVFRIPRHTPCVLHLIPCHPHEPALRLSSSFFVSVLYFVPHYWVLARRLPSSFLVVVFRAQHTVSRALCSTPRTPHPLIYNPPWCADCVGALYFLPPVQGHLNTVVRSWLPGHDCPTRRTNTQKNTQPDDRTGCRGRTARVRLWNYCAGAASGAAIMPMAVSGVASAGMLSACFTSGRMSTTVFSS